MAFYEKPVALLAADQAITGSWVDLGDEINVQGFGHFGLIVGLDVNDAQNVRIRALAKAIEAGTAEAVYPIKVTASTEVKVTAHYYELDSDADQTILLDWENNHLANAVQFQVIAGTAGASAGKILAATSYVLRGE
jgi:hypothetical protein